MVTVASGNERTGVDLQVKPVPMVKVSGTVVRRLRDRRRTSRCVCCRTGSEDLGRTGDVAGTLTDAGGAFTFLTVPAGDYVLKVVQIPRPAATSAQRRPLAIGSGMTVMTSGAPTLEPPPIPAEPTLWATVPVNIGDTDVSGLSVVLRAGLRVSGRVEFEGAAERPAPAQLTRIPVLIEPVDGQLDRSVTPPGRIDAKGQFTSYGSPEADITSGPPRLPRVGPSRARSSASATSPTCRSSSTRPTCRTSILTFTDRPASLSGTVQLTERSARDGVAVIVFPADSKAWMDTGANPRRMRRVATSDSGAYNVAALPAGFVLRRRGLRGVAGDWQDPAFLEQLTASAAHVQISDGEAATQSLRVQEIR